MGEITNKLKEYIFNNLDIKLQLQLWKKRKKLPFFLTDTFEFYEAKLIKMPLLIYTPKENVELTPATIKKHLQQIQKNTERSCVFVQGVITSYNRKRLIEQRVSFIIPGNQMYLPELGIDLREYFQAIKRKEKPLSPSAQAVLIYTLLNKNKKRITPSSLSKKLGYSLMTLGRAFDELENAGICKTIRCGKERLIQFKKSKKEIWEQASSFLRNPVRKRFWVKGKKPEILSGLSALSKKTLLASPSIPTYAISPKAWNELKFLEVPNKDEAAFEIEVWHYDPALFSSKGTVDVFSLYLSLRETDDERIEIALDKLMERIE